MGIGRRIVRLTYGMGHMRIRVAQNRAEERRMLKKPKPLKRR